MTVVLGRRRRASVARVGIAAFLLGLGPAGGRPMEAHHYFAAAFDAAGAVQLRGVLVRIEWTNPHVHFYVDVKEAGGSVVRWICEGGAPGALSRRGLGRADLKPGDTVVVDGYRAKGRSPFAVVRQLTLSGGRIVPGALAGG